ncbi:hypothetical protein CYCD_06400 [Tenuifilaceae bacterium CYCD]|nr:hypothetical protein CYCD_06400 [Tenuifilaceae bacterium CYCD]
MNASFVIAEVIGGWDAAIILLTILIFFGGKKIPDLMSGLGRGVSEFKNEMSERVKNFNAN